MNYPACLIIFNNLSYNQFVFISRMKLKPLYATIMNILSQELFIGSKDNVDEELSRFLKSFFQDDSTITAWNEVIFLLLKIFYSGKRPLIFSGNFLGREK